MILYTILSDAIIIIVIKLLNSKRGYKTLCFPKHIQFILFISKGFIYTISQSNRYSCQPSDRRYKYF